MSACNILQQPGRGMIHMFNDGAATRKDGTLHSVQSKVRTLAGGMAAYSVRGASGPWLECIEKRLARHADFDALRDAIANDAFRCHRMALAMMPIVDPDDRKLEIVLIGWSQSAAEPQAWFLSADPARDGIDHLAPFEMERLESPRGAPKIPDVLGTLGLPSNATWDDVDALDAAAAGIEWVTQQRYRTDPDDGWPFHVVGGFVEMTTASASGIERRIIHHWPDIVGQPIIP